MIEIKGLTKVYKLGRIELPILKGISFTVNAREFVSIMGPSGSGKSTCLHILGCLDRPSSGSYMLDGREVSRLSDSELARVRNKKIGFVFQSFNLLPRASALQNVELPLIYAGISKRIPRCKQALERVGLGKRIKHRPSELSGGEQQRVAIARAIVNDPAILLADEPTGNLDSVSGKEIMAIFTELHRQGMTVLLITHDRGVAHYGSRIIHFLDGAISEEEEIAAEHPHQEGTTGSPPPENNAPEGGKP
ncbi:MAG: ABC transporter ATP-binding protein [Candidatus Eremiobacteraeota bacterium]|nr:ABC transporter ATP-binding protein [Candidatus Eremiobacteraeota bacterium]